MADGPASLKGNRQLRILSIDCGGIRGSGQQEVIARATLAGGLE